MHTQEKTTSVANGWPILGALVAAAFVIVPIFLLSLFSGGFGVGVMGVAIAVLLAITWIFLCAGFFTLQPNEAAVLVLFGDYKGTEKKIGFRWANPLYTKIRVSLRARNLNGETIKVNDSRGNPIEIATVVVWQVADTAKAVFDVDDFAHYVTVQSESALRHLAMAYPYDNFEGDTLSLQGSTDEISKALQDEVQERAAEAGVRIIEARLSHLAYAQEIAGAMLQRQQAEAIVAARSRIVDGATGMVKMALDHLKEIEGLELDNDRKAAMVGNLLVVLCGHSDVTPVVNMNSDH